MKKIIFTLSLVLCFVFAAQAQSDYKSAVGLRLGYPTSVTFKHFFNEKGAAEAFVGFRGWGWGRAINRGAMYQHPSPIAELEGLKWHVGGGAGVWFWTYDNDFGFGGNTYGSTNLYLMACLGLDYKFEEFPINISAEWVPSFTIGDSYLSRFGWGYGALAVRYVLK